MSFVDEHKDRTEGGLRWGVESICQVLCGHGWQIAPATYYAAKRREAEARARRERDELDELGLQRYQRAALP